MPPKKKEAELRMPAPRAVEDIENFVHYGIVVEKSGEDIETSKKNRVMYLFSPTVRKHCGKLVCSVDWKDYQLGEWMKFTQQRNEAYFGSSSCEPAFPTRIHPNDVTIVQVFVEFFLIPPCISRRRCHNLGDTLLKMWSPQLGGTYVDVKSCAEYKLKEDVVYKGWLQYSINPINFDEHDVDPEGWPYEPIIYWRLVFVDGEDHDILTSRDSEYYNYLCDQLVKYAEVATAEEKKKRITDRAKISIFEQVEKRNQISQPKFVIKEDQSSFAPVSNVSHNKVDNSRCSDNDPIVFSKSTSRPSGMTGPSSFSTQHYQASKRVEERPSSQRDNSPCFVEPISFTPPTFRPTGIYKAPSPFNLNQQRSTSNGFGNNNSVSHPQNSDVNSSPFNRVQNQEALPKKAIVDPISFTPSTFVPVAANFIQKQNTETRPSGFGFAHNSEKDPRGWGF